MNFGYRCGRTDRLPRIDESIRDPRIDAVAAAGLFHLFIYFSQADGNTTRITLPQHKIERKGPKQLCASTIGQRWKPETKKGL